MKFRARYSSISFTDAIVVVLLLVGLTPIQSSAWLIKMLFKGLPGSDPPAPESIALLDDPENNKLSKSYVYKTIYPPERGIAKWRSAGTPCKTLDVDMKYDHDALLEPPYGQPGMIAVANSIKKHIGQVYVKYLAFYSDALCSAGPPILLIRLEEKRPLPKPIPAPKPQEIQIPDAKALFRKILNRQNDPEFEKQKSTGHQVGNFYIPDVKQLFQRIAGIPKNPNIGARPGIPLISYSGGIAEDTFNTYQQAGGQNNMMATGNAQDTQQEEYFDTLNGAVHLINLMNIPFNKVRSWRQLAPRPSDFRDLEVLQSFDINDPNNPSYVFVYDPLKGTGKRYTSGDKEVFPELDATMFPEGLNAFTPTYVRKELGNILRELYQKWLAWENPSTSEFASRLLEDPEAIDKVPGYPSIRPSILTTSKEPRDEEIKESKEESKEILQPRTGSDLGKARIRSPQTPKQKDLIEDTNSATKISPSKNEISQVDSKPHEHGDERNNQPSFLDEHLLETFDFELAEKAFADLDKNVDELPENNLNAPRE